MSDGTLDAYRGSELHWYSMLSVQPSPSSSSSALSPTPSESVSSHSEGSRGKVSL